ncbi:Oidioi.mRNA.OKI2018_I69.chr2.g7641.t1.cds [Oikopleura dioica]|uniref:Oidioi.mRNA.OKI2018_I69.chr2.g7641.t1.cds n=1 Tax=Oikopleura dioica TaxID=34765 RepID=A0ABN7TBK5_OIKDI|nr:Oidioi.mRNA.OKI2018_I69.chr2.g7641.t1.cds [Oikopleura dioica]
MRTLSPVDIEEMKEQKGMRYLPIPEKTPRKSFLKTFGSSRISKAAGTVRRASVQVRSFFNDIHRLSPRYPRSRRLSEITETNLQLPSLQKQRIRHRSHSINLGELHFLQDIVVDPIGIAPQNTKTLKGVTWASDLEMHRSVSFSELFLSNHGTEESPLLAPTWSQTKTLQGLEADALAKDVRARRGTVMHNVSLS